MTSPNEWTKPATLKNGKKILLRPILAGDIDMLWHMFSTLSKESLDNLVPPFTRERIEKWTNNINYDSVLTIVATVEERRKHRIVGTCSLSFSDLQIYKHKGNLAITVHDEYQNKGLGSTMIRHMLDIARKKGLKKICLHVRSTNDRAMHVYVQLGFEVEGTFRKERYIKGQFNDEIRMAVFL